MAKLSSAMLCLILLAGAAPADAAKPPPRTAPPGEDIWPFPPPDPRSWWDDPRPKTPEAADPLGGRRAGRGTRTPAIDNGVEPTLYRLWGLQPLQSQALYDGEMILELWIRPSGGVRQSVVRITLRRDGAAFVQARAGVACCEPEIGRRVGFDARTDPAPFRPLAEHRMWASPHDVRVSEPGAVEDALCIDGTAYDLTLVLPDRARTLRRACDPAAVGEIADALEPMLGAALGHEPRIDVLFTRGADFSSARHAYEALLAAGGRLAPGVRTPAAPPTQ